MNAYKNKKKKGKKILNIYTYITAIFIEIYYLCLKYIIIFKKK